MHLQFRNVNHAFRVIVRAVYDGTFPVSVEGSRNGDVLRLEEPLLLTYDRPRERVLFNSRRNANPFMHLYEALWMLAGRNDLAPVAYYAKQMGEYSDDGVTLNGAYGYRWRHSTIPGYRRPEGVANLPEGVDQLDLVVKHLRDNPHSRRAVIQMWNVEDDLLRISDGRLTCPRCCNADRYRADCRECKATGKVGAGPSKDVCCNLSVIVQGREQNVRPNTPNRGDGVPLRFLDLYVTNRSNDLIWGLLGANAVHFSFLQEYLAARLGWEVGRMHTFTANAHAYTWNWKPEDWLGYYGSADEVEYVNECCMVPLVKDPARFEEELPILVNHFDGRVKGPNPAIDELGEPFFRHVAGPALRAFELHKLYKETDTALRMCGLIEADDWRTACTEWIQRRRAKHERQR